MDRTVAVTGGSGKLGRAVVAALIEEGWTVVNFDRVPSPDSRVCFIRTDLTGCGQVVEALSGIDEVHRGVNAVVHLAAIPGATFAPNVATFDNNLVSTFHVFQAAKLFKINNLVWASSETLLGYPFNNPPAYVPLDDDVPPTPEVVYALAKDLEEEMARQYCRWNPDQKMIGLRFSNVMDPGSTRIFLRSKRIRCRASGTCGPTSTCATELKRSSGPWPTTSPASTTSSSLTLTP